MRVHGAERSSFPAMGNDSRLDDFYRWAYDPGTNIVRGKYAEYLVGRALGCLDTTIGAWEPYDLLVDDRCRVEVKASAYVQNWTQAALSDLQWTGLRSKQGFAADVYVLSAYLAKSRSEYDITNTDHWCFWVIGRGVIQENGWKSMGEATARRLAGEPIGYAGLAAAVRSQCGSVLRDRVEPRA